MPHDINFLQEHEAKPIRDRRGRKRIVFAVGITAAVVLAVWLTIVLVAAGEVTAAALDGRDALFQARDAAVALQFDEAMADLDRADGSLAKAERGMAILRTARFIPWVGAQIEAADAIVGSSRQIIAALSDIIDTGSELIRLSGLTEEDLRSMSQGLEPSLTFDDLSADTKLAILTRLFTSADDLELTGVKIDIALQELDAIPRGEVVRPVLDALDPIEAKLQELDGVIHTLAIASRLLPEFAGLGEERAHLLLFMNNAELRPGGGFLGTYGILRMLNGDIRELETSDVYTLDDAAASRVTRTPPAPLTQYNAATQWFFRDSNWSPDFAISSRQAIDMYGEENQGTPVAIGGVVGITPTYVSKLLALTGPIEVSGQTFDAQNFGDKLEYQVEYGYVGQGIPTPQRKEIIAGLVAEMKSRLYALPLSRWLDVLDATEEAIRTKQLVLYSATQDTEDLLSDVGWGGRVVPKTPDVQMVVDANLASLKSDPAVHRTVTYQVFKNTAGEWIGKTTVHYEHTGAFDWKTTRYRTYVRLYVPEGSTFIRAEGTLANDKIQNPSGAAGPVDVGTDLGLTVFGAFTSVEPGESHDISFEYKIAPQVAAQMDGGSYDLTVIKQVGAPEEGLTVDLGFGTHVSSATPPEDASEWGDDAYRLNTQLDQDRTIHVEL